MLLVGVEDLTPGCYLLGWAAMGVAQSAEGSPAEKPGEIIITGERTPRSMRQTSASVDVTTAERIEALSGADRIEQVLQHTPNVVLGGPSGPVIRGQDANGVLQGLPGFLGGARPRTTLQIDGRPVTYNELAFGAAGIWDVKRIEVFRTPQTTTQGLNSIGGAIFINSKDPTYDWEGRARLLAGNYKTRQASIALSGPIVDDQLAFRAAADIRRGRPSSKIVDVTRGANPNNDDYSLLRLKLLSEPGFWPSSRFQLTYAHTESLMPLIEGIRPPFRKRRDPIDNYGTFGTNVDSLTAVLELPVTTKLRASTTLAYGDARVRRFNLPGLGESDTQSYDYSVEQLLDWNPDGPARLVGGVSHRRLSLDQLIDLSVFPGVGIGDFDDEQRSVGLFGEVTLQPFARTIVTAGLRYQWDRQRRSGAIGTPARQIPLSYDRSFSAWLPKLSVAYDFSDELRAGMLVQRAYNPGGTTLRLDTGRNENFDPETLWDYELFARGRFAGGALVVAGNLFYMAMRDNQRFRTFLVPFPGGSPILLAQLFNVPRARSYGAELTVDWRASQRLSARAAVGLLETKITRTDAESAVFQGSEFARSPGLTVSGEIDWRPIDPLRLSAQVRHHGSYFSDDRETVALRIGPATIVDTRASWTAGRVTLFGYARNLFGTFRLRFLNHSTLATAHDPREIGVGLDSNF
jgi:outer membrane receptor protein involved in Fe transport